MSALLFENLTRSRSSHVDGAVESNRLVEKPLTVKTFDPSELRQRLQLRGQTHEAGTGWRSFSD